MQMSNLQKKKKKIKEGTMYQLKSSRVLGLADRVCLMEDTLTKYKSYSIYLVYVKEYVVYRQTDQKQHANYQLIKANLTKWNKTEKENAY